MTKPYTKTHLLRWPINGLTEVIVSTVQVGEMRDMRAKFNMDSPDEAKRDKYGFNVAVFTAHTGLTADQRGELTKPDLNSIDQIIHELVMTPSYELQPASPGVVRNPDEFPLLVPVIDHIRGKDPITVVTMTPPTVRLTDSVRELGIFDQEREVMAVCTNLMPDVVMKLHMPDWIAMQTRLTDFLAETADYFPLQTSNA